MRSLLSIALLLLLASCSKETSVVDTYPKTPPLRVSGLTDLVIERSPFRNAGRYPQQQLNLQVLYGFGDARKVQLSVEPVAGIGTRFSVAAGYPDFSTLLLLTDSLQAPAGNYEMRLTAQSDSGVAQTLKFNLRLAGDTSCAGYFAGKTYRVYNNCLPQGNTLEGARLERIAPGNDTLLLTNFRADGLSLRIVTDCNQQAVSIPTQTIGSSTFSGRGTLQLVYGNPPATPYFQLVETTAGGNVITCGYGLQMR